LPAWTPLFAMAAAVVTDVGAPLSHAAIVARELGIPAVVGCGDATMRLHTGDRVLVDGGQGVVEILEIILYGFPDNFQINTKVIMNQFVTHSSNFLPMYFRV